MPVGTGLLQGAGPGVGASPRGCWQPACCCCCWWWPPWPWGLAVSRGEGHGLEGSRGGGCWERVWGWVRAGLPGGGQGWGVPGAGGPGLVAASCLATRSCPWSACTALPLPLAAIRSPPTAFAFPSLDSLFLHPPPAPTSSSPHPSPPSPGLPLASPFPPPASFLFMAS